LRYETLSYGEVGLSYGVRQRDSGDARGCEYEVKRKEHDPRTGLNGIEVVGTACNEHATNAIKQEDVVSQRRKPHSEEDVCVNDRRIV